MKARTLFTLACILPGLLVLAGVLSNAHPSLAAHPGDCGYPADTPLPAGPTVTAQQVEDGSASLMEFTLAARGRYEELLREVTSFGESLQVQCLTRQEGSAWRSGSTYLVVLTADGRVFQHSKSLGLSGRLLNPLIYGAILQAAGINPAELTDLASAREAFAAAGNGGSFGVQDIPGASGFAFPVAHALHIWTAGFDIDEAHLVPVADEEIDYGDPDVTASEVVDRATLKTFVTEAWDYFFPIWTSGDPTAVAKLRIALRDENGPWKDGSVYLYVLELTSDIVLFHGAFPDIFEFQPLVGIARDGVTGELILPQVLEAATSSPEGGFVEYFYDDPTDDTDRADIPKVGYAREFSGHATVPQFIALAGEPGGETHEIRIIIGSGFYGSAPEEPEGVAEGSRAEVEVTVLGDAVEGLTVEFSRAIAGRSRHFAWNAITDADGQASLTISGGRQVSGFYQARARNTDGEVLGQWHSIPLNRNKRQVLELTLGGGMRIAGVESLAAAKEVASASGLEPNAPNPFNSSTQIAYHLSSPGPVHLVIYNVLGQPVRTLVDEYQSVGSYRIQWDARDQQGAALSSGIYITRLSYPGGVLTRRLLYLK